MDKKKDEQFMREALKEAAHAFEVNEVPVGAVLVFQEEIIARAHNRVEELQSATAHAEILCLQQAYKQFSNWRLLDTTLYCTLEPCAMCAGAFILSRVGCLVWGAPDLRHGANGSIYNLFNGAHPIHQLNIRTGVLAEESAQLMKDFFQKKRLQKI